jgi:hypothetical protein
VFLDSVAMTARRFIANQFIVSLRVGKATMTHPRHDDESTKSVQSLISASSSESPSHLPEPKLFYRNQQVRNTTIHFIVESSG